MTLKLELRSNPQAASQTTQGGLRRRDTYPSATLLIENVERLCVDAQERLVELIDSGVYRRLGDNEQGRFEDRLILTATWPLSQLTASGLLMPSLGSLLSPAHVFLPDLRDRLEDLPVLAEHFLQGLRKDRRSRKLSVDHSAYRSLLTYDRPGTSVSCGPLGLFKPCSLLVEYPHRKLGRGIGDKDPALWICSDTEHTVELSKSSPSHRHLNH